MSLTGRQLSSVSEQHQRVSWSALVGYDFFISYRRSDATPYAAALFGALHRADLRCFLDDNDATPGKPLTKKLQWALKRSKVLLIIASPDLPQSTWVPKEVEIFAKSQRDIILINVKEGMKSLLASKTLGPSLRKDALWIDEQPGIGPGDAPSMHVVGSVQKNFNHRRANRNLSLIAGVVTIAIAGFASVAAWQWNTALARLDVVQSQALAADARRLSPQEPFLAVETAVAAFATSDSPDAETALLEGLLRVPNLKRFFPCAESQKPIGPAFSDASDGLLAYGCMSYGTAGPEMALRVVDLDGAQKYAANIVGDARSLSFVDGLHLRVEMFSRIIVLDLQTGKLLDSSAKPALPSPMRDPGGDRETWKNTNTCVHKNPFSIRYFTSAVSPDGRLLAYTTETNQIMIADLTNGGCDGRPLDAHTHNVWAIAWSPTGRYLASAGAIADGDNHHGVVLWDREQISSIARVIYKSSRFGGIDSKFAISADGSSWVCGDCQDRIIWDGQPIDLPTGVYSGIASGVAMTPDGQEAAVAFSGHIVVIRRSAGGFGVELRRGLSIPVRALAYVNGALYAEDEKLNIWRVSDTTAEKVITSAPFDSVSCLDDGPIGPHFISEVFNQEGAALLKLSEPDSGEVKEFALPSDADTCAALTFSPAAMTAVRANAAYRPLLIVRLSSGSAFQEMRNPLRSASGLQTVLRNARLSRDGRRLIASSDNSDLAVFDLAAERLIGVINLGEVNRVSLAADGNVALIQGGGKIMLVDLDPLSWQRKAQQLVSDR